MQSAPTSRKTSQSFHRSSYQSHAFPVPEAPVDLEKLVNLAKMEMEAEMERDESVKLERRGPAAAARKKSVRGYAGNNSRAHLRRRSSEDLYVKGEKESFFSRQNRLNRLCDRGGRGPWGRGEYWDYLPMVAAAEGKNKENSPVVILEFYKDCENKLFQMRKCAGISEILSTYLVSFLVPCSYRGL